jgi:hypothetical protein
LESNYKSYLSIKFETIHQKSFSNNVNLATVVFNSLPSTLLGDPDDKPFDGCSSLSFISTPKTIICPSKCTLDLKQLFKGSNYTIQDWSLTGCMVPFISDPQDDTMIIGCDSTDKVIIIPSHVISISSNILSGTEVETVLFDPQI